MKTLFTMREAAKFLNTSVHNIEYYINTGLLTPQIISSKRHLTIQELYNLSDKNRDGSNVKRPSSMLRGHGNRNYEDTTKSQYSSNTDVVQNNAPEDINTSFLSDTDKESYENLREEIKEKLWI